MWLGGKPRLGLIFPEARRSYEALIIQNSNAYDIGLTSAWGGFRNALWKRRTPETEKPLAAFLEHDAIKGILFARGPAQRADQSRHLEIGFCIYGTANRAPGPPGLVL